MAETLILSVGSDPSILYAREEVLRSEGYIVVSASSIGEAFHLFKDGDFDLIILGQTIPAKDRERLTCLIRASGSRIPIATICPTPQDRSVFPEAIIQDDPVELVSGIRRLLAKRFELAALGLSSRSRGDLLTVAAHAVTRAA
jgi:CheY-like chemotaxis protein